MASMKFKAIGIVPTLMLCSAGVHLSNVYMPDNLRFFAGYFCGVAVMFVTAILRDKERRAQVAERVAFAVETMPTVEPLPVADSYRTQAPGDAPTETVEQPAPVASAAPRDPHHESYRRDLELAELLIDTRREVHEAQANLREIHDILLALHR